MGILELFKRKKHIKYTDWDEDDEDGEEGEEGNDPKLTLAGNLELKVMTPTKLEDLLTAVDYLAVGSTILLNLEGVNSELRGRMIDFISGASYALDACIKKATQDSYFVAPKSVDVGGEIFDNTRDDEVFTDL
ncbi:MAG: cell division protein SepF [Clostridia bacterium]|nr:cell division protein SepF [Clostridia bacterium]